MICKTNGSYMHIFRTQSIIPKYLVVLGTAVLVPGIYTSVYYMYYDKVSDKEKGIGGAEIVQCFW